MPFAKDNHVINAFPPDRADQPLRISVLPRRPRGCGPISDAHGANTPNKHGLLLRPDELPAILQTGERVLSRGEARAYEKTRASGPPVMFTFNVTTPDAASFRRAQSRITADLASALRRAERNL